MWVNCCKKGQTLLQRTCHGVSCCGQWCQTARSILGKGPEVTHGTWLLACTCVCTCVRSGVSVSGEGRGPRARNFTCLTNNILRIDCYWSVPELGQGSRPRLLFTRLLAAHTSASCRAVSALWCCRLRQCSCHLTISSSLSTTACLGGSGSAWWSCSTCPGDTVNSGYKPGHQSCRGANVTLLGYELGVKRQEEAWERAQHGDHIVGVTWLILEAFELDPGFILEARRRVRMATLEDDVAEEERYTGQWSEWSQPVCFQAPQRQGPLIPPWGRPGNTFVAVSVCLLLTGLTYLLFKLSPRLAWGPPEPVCC
uniref:Interleukin 9 receptor n=1 Tax=Theropithecus gelada TaxID=9565 RepID=A0A8D2E9R1_THEGE